MQDKVVHFFHRDDPVVVDIRQPEDGGRHPPIAEDLVEGGGGDWVILAYEIGDGLQEFDNIDAVLMPTVVPM